MSRKRIVLLLLGFATTVAMAVLAPAFGEALAVFAGAGWVVALSVSWPTRFSAGVVAVLDTIDSAEGGRAAFRAPPSAAKPPPTRAPVPQRRPSPAAATGARKPSLVGSAATRSSLPSSPARRRLGSSSWMRRWLRRFRS